MLPSELLTDAVELRRQVSAVKQCRSMRKTDMVHHSCTPVMQIDAQSYEVGADGQLLTCQPATVLPKAQRYFRF